MTGSCSVINPLFRLALVVMLLSLAALMSDVSPCQARMEKMTDGDLAGVTGAGFSSFSFSNGVAQADFAGVSGSTWTEIDSLKLGFWDKGGGKGWDQNWTGVKIGSQASDLVFNGFYIKAAFDPTTVNDPANRQLQSITIGSKDVTGVVSANFQSFTGIVGGSDIARGNLGTQSYQFNHSELSFTMEVSGSRKGIWVNMGTATRL